MPDPRWVVLQDIPDTERPYRFSGMWDKGYALLPHPADDGIILGCRLAWLVATQTKSNNAAISSLHTPLCPLPAVGFWIASCMSKDKAHLYPKGAPCCRRA